MADEPENLECRVYALANPERIAGEAPLVTQAFSEIVGARTMRSSDTLIDINESSGWLSYENEKLVWPNIRPSLPATAEKAAAFAERALIQLTTRLSTAGDPELLDRAGTTSLLPPKGRLKFSEILLVQDPYRGFPAHWLYRAQPQVPLATGRLTPLHGASVDIRIGSHGRIASLFSTYRPVTTESVTTKLRSFYSGWSSRAVRHAHGGGSANRDHSHNGEDGPPHILVYLQEGDGVPQHYTAPYYLTTDGHVQTLVSASPWSLTGGFVPRETQDASEVSLFVSGGSGDYQFRWGYVIESDPGGEISLLPSEQSAVEGPADLGQSTAKLPGRGVYRLLVNIRDTRTGAFRHLQQHYHSGAPVESDGQRVVA